eukprot:CAMPEP_0196754076 /NCGR_PEP_ID=MMETSP1091-20130531/92654_1 /TAXON_ID=302021 /ORGANISM="Rhodomonas sp., Strain CCMP768" /LENGTH=86 /DNA_ID=CAMNT_0042102277 /DNA_START=9 /DNA_END=269 /DNA_ORIENTATION=-
MSKVQHSPEHSPRFSLQRDALANLQHRVATFPGHDVLAHVGANDVLAPANEDQLAAHGNPYRLFQSRHMVWNNYRHETKNFHQQVA